MFDGDLLADIPEWLLDLVKPEERQRPAPPAAPLDNVSRYLKRMMAVDRVNGLLREAATAPRGRRQSTYFWCANRFREIVDEGVLDLAEAHDLLFNAAMELPTPARRGWCFRPSGYCDEHHLYPRSGAESHVQARTVPAARPGAPSRCVNGSMARQSFGGNVSFDIAPGGVGKTSHKIVELLAMASGKPRWASHRPAR